MYLQDGRYADVEAVMDDMSEISLNEMGKSGVVNAWQGLRRAKICKDTGFLKVMRDDKGPLFIFGAVRTDVASMRTWFIAADRYFANPLAVRSTAKAMARVAQSYPRHVFESISKSDHPKTTKWFESLGFKLVKWQDGGKVYRFVGRNSTGRKKSAMVEDTRA